MSEFKIFDDEQERLSDIEQKIKYLQKYTQKDLLKNTRGLNL